MSRAAALCLASLQKLSEARNSQLTQTCEHGHPLCALTRNGPCATEAAELIAAHHQPEPANHRVVTQSHAVRPASNAPQLTLF